MSIGSSGQKVPRQTAGTPPVDPNATQTKNAQADGGEREQQDQEGGDKSQVAEPQQAASAPSGLTADDKKEVATIAATAAAEVMERFFSRQSDAKNNPATRRHGWDAEDRSPDRVLNIPVDGALEDVQRTDLHLESVDMENFESHADEMAFQREHITIIVHESGDPNEQAVIPLSVNGVTAWIMRGEEVKIRRCFAELLFRAKPETVKVQVGKDPSSGDVVNRTTRKSALKYPFTIVNDPNPRGRRWREKMAHEG